MSVPLVMEGVVVPVSTQLVATTVHVPQDILWLQTIMVVLVSYLLFESEYMYNHAYYTITFLY